MERQSGEGGQQTDGLLAIPCVLSPVWCHGISLLKEMGFFVVGAPCGSPVLHNRNTNRWIGVSLPSSLACRTSLAAPLSFSINQSI
jgi:hypothetical protein